MYKKSIMYSFLLLSSLNLSAVTLEKDEIVKGTMGWKESEKKAGFDKCITMTLATKGMPDFLPSWETRENVCNCITDEIMKRSTYRDFSLMTRLSFRKSLKKQNKYSKKVFQNSNDTRVDKLYKNMANVVWKKCVTVEVANKGIKEKNEAIHKRNREKEALKKLKELENN